MHYFTILNPYTTKFPIVFIIVENFKTMHNTILIEI